MNIPIDLTKGAGWDETTWAIHEQTVERAAKKADVGLAYLGITYDEPKVGVIRNETIARGEALTLGGCAKNEVNFLIFTEQTEHYKPRRVHNTADWSALTVHEVVHCARFERYPESNPVELVATEGLAYVAERAHIARFCAKQIVPQILETDLDEPDALLHEALRAVADGQMTYHESFKWAEHIGPGMHVNSGSLIGAQLVHRLVERGHSLPDLMNQPAEDILGL